MELINGETLRMVARELTLEEKIRVMALVADAVHAAHRVGLVHRDLKSSNILVERREDGSLFPYVLDFGLAREEAVPGVSVSGAIAGTPWYMSPEQVRGETTLDRRSDVYSLGVVLYETLTGELPFPGSSSLDVLSRILTEEPLPPRRLHPALPADVEQIVLKSMEKDPLRRYQSARALAEDLHRYLDGEPVMARPASLGLRIVKKVRKYKERFAAGAIAVVLVSIFAGIALRERFTAREEAALAQSLGREVSQIETVMRLGAMLPLHPLDRERQIVRAKMSRIEEQMHSMLRFRRTL